MTFKYKFKSLSEIKTTSMDENGEVVAVGYDGNTAILAVVYTHKPMTDDVKSFLYRPEHFSVSFDELDAAGWNTISDFGHRSFSSKKDAIAYAHQVMSSEEMGNEMWEVR